MSFLKSVYSATFQKHPHPSRCFAIALAYLLVGKLSLLVTYSGSTISLIWLPAGLSIAALMRWGYVSWIGIFSGALLLKLWLGEALPMAFAIATGGTLGPLLSAWLLQRFHIKVMLGNTSYVFLLIFAAMVGMLLPASIAIYSMVMIGSIAPQQTLGAWATWWLGDVIGVLISLPGLLNVSKQNIVQLWHGRNKFLAWLLFTCTIELAIFSALPSFNGQWILLAFMVLPCIIWSSMNFGIAGGSIAVLVISITAISASVNYQLPFQQQAIGFSIFRIWIFIGMLSLVTMMISILQLGRETIEQKLRLSETKLRAVIDGALDAIISIDESGFIVEFNPAATRMFGYQQQQVIGRLLAEVIIPPAQRHAHSVGHRQFVTTGNKKLFDRRIELIAMRADGSEFPVEVTLTSLYDKGWPIVTGFLRDITTRKTAEEEIRRLAFFDELTGLPNRRLLIDRLKQALASTARGQNFGAVLFIDLDNFKSLNDTQGHDVGDLLLIEVARRIQDLVRKEDTVARLGGDEFVVVVECMSQELNASLTQAKMVGEKILAAINIPYQLNNIAHYNTSSLGISLFNGLEVDVDELLKRADTAMYQAKSGGKNTLRFYNPEIQAALKRRVAMESQLRKALVQQQFVMYFQSQLNTNGQIYGAEILLRWLHPEQGMILPMQFIPLAEESGLIIEIGHWVLHAACQQLQRWQEDLTTRHLLLAVNVSARQFQQSDFVAQVISILEQTGAKPELLKLELTESVVLDNIEEAIQKMHGLTALGVRFSMDDFGTGYSSLAYLKQLPMQQVKIDRSFVRDIATNASDAAIVQTIIAMSKHLHLHVIAEGVETQAQFELLKSYGCQQFQGYFFSKPVDLQTFEQLLLENRIANLPDSGENNA